MKSRKALKTHYFYPIYTLLFGAVDEILYRVTKCAKKVKNSKKSAKFTILRTDFTCVLKIFVTNFVTK